MLRPYPPTQLIHYDSIFRNFLSANMSIFSSHNNNKNGMGSPSFRELKNQASFFFKEKIKTARLALTDVTPAQLLAEEVTAGNQWGPDTQTMRLIVKAAFEVDDYCRIVEILHKRFSKFDKQNWRVSYNSLILLEYLLTHGPESAGEEFQIDKDIITEMESFQFTDDKGSFASSLFTFFKYVVLWDNSSHCHSFSNGRFNWGLAVRKKSKRVLSLLENRPLLKQERDRARKITRGIKGFGSFGERGPDHGVLKQSSSFGALGISDYLYHDHENNNSSTEMERKGDEPQLRHKEIDSSDPSRKGQLQSTSETETCHKGNTVSNCLSLPQKFKRLDCTDVSKPLLDEQNGKHEIGVSTNEDHHPFCHAESQASVSLLTTSY